MSLFKRALFVGCLALSLPFAAQAEVKIAINSPRGELATLKQWQQFGPYLEQQLGEKVMIKAFSVTEIMDVAEKGEFDFVFANPMQTLVIREQFKYIPLVTLAKKNGPHFAGVIITKAGSPIKTGADLRGKKVIGLSADAAGAHIFQGYHLLQQGVDIYKDLAAFSIAKKLDDIVFSVRAGLFDAGFIRTGVLESMVKEGKINMEDFAVVDDRQSPGFNLRHSTILYPEWSFCAKSGTDPELQARMKKVLLAVEESSEIAQSAKISGFVEALPLDEFLKAVQALKVPPFDGS